MSTAKVQQEPIAVELTPAAITLNALGDTARLTARVLDANDSVIPDAAVSWTSSSSAASVVGGLVTADQNGTSAIEAAAGTVSASVPVTVEQIAAELSLTSDTVFISVGSSSALGASVRDALGSEVVGASTAWSSSDASIITVDADGQLSAIRSGDAVITAAAGSAQAHAVAVVRDTLTSTTGSVISDGGAKDLGGYLLQSTFDLFSAEPVSPAPGSVSGPQAVAVAFSTTVSTSIVCPLGGNMVMDGTLDGWVDDVTPELFSMTIDVTQTHTGCGATGYAGQNFVLDALVAVSLTLDGDLQGTTWSGTWNGEIGWTSDSGFGTCTVALSYSGSDVGGATAVSIEGSICGHTITGWEPPTG
jgi:uncharacterized protein YjdB